MATRSFLLDSHIEEGLRRLAGDGAAFPETASVLRQSFSLWLEQCLLTRLQSLGDFTALKPILLGSWSRHELCPKSDIDLLFAGQESAVRDFIAKAFREGLKLRARTPEYMQDWRVGVEPFDVLALKSALAFSPAEINMVRGQQALAQSKRREILSAIRKERDERRQRQDSISNYLEPNLKYGAGAIRDIEQALAVKTLFPEKFADTNPYPFKVLVQIKDELLYLRCLVHLLGSGDILTAHDQLEVATRLRMNSAKELMTFVQGELERASFYADWAVENALAAKKPRALAQTKIESLSGAVQRLGAQPSLLLQFQIRLRVDALSKPLGGAARGRVLHQAAYPDRSDAFLLGLYRTRILEVLIPDLKKLKGLVQHDHYHRYTADAHLVQTLREVQRAKTRKRSLGVLGKLTTDLSNAEWWTLKLAALFHDLAKGRKGDHSTEGAKLVTKYFKEWDYAEGLCKDVHWLVENHLIMSTAAFRQNPQAQSTWKRLFERGVQGRRLIMLALFTAIDIRATNPEAWTDWKARLLYDLVENLRSNEALSMQKHLQYATKKKSQDIEDWLFKVDPALLQSLTPRVLVDDLKAAAKGVQLPPKVLTQGSKLWVRFHSPQDETGLFLGYVKRLYGLGLNIQMSSVSTLKGVGVYDWFCLRTDKSPRQIGQWLNMERAQAVQVPAVEFQSIDLMAQDQEEWIFSFRGRDQRGLLLAAAQALVEEKLPLRWARVHTWGGQIDDVFSVQPLGEVENTLNRLRNRFVT